MQARNIKAYLTLIGLKLDKKVYQIATRLHSSLLYSTIMQSRFTYKKQSLTTLEILEKRYIKLLRSNIQELEKKPVYIITS